jgi:hypothetical protein
VSDDRLASCYRTLELVPGASLTEIKNAYIRLKRLYSEDTPLLRVMTSDFPPERRPAILAEVEAAYREILASINVPAETRAPVITPEADRGLVLTGAGLRRRRESLGLTLEGIHEVTKIRAEILDNIESERFETLPDESFLKNHLIQYARSLGLDPGEVLDQYLGRFREWTKRRSRAGGPEGER